MKVPLSDYELDLIKNLPFTEYGRVFFRVLQEEHDEEDKLAKGDPDQVPHARAYRCGAVTRLEQVLGWPSRAEKDIENRRKGKGERL